MTPKKWRVGACLAALAWVFIAGGAKADTAPIAVAVAPFDYLDSSGEVRDQRASHAARVEAFDNTIRGAVAGNPRYRLADLACGGACTAGTASPDALIAAARAAHARFLVYGGVHKLSTLVQWARVEIVDIDTGRLRLARTVTFRGDNDEAWARAASYVGNMITE